MLMLIFPNTWWNAFLLACSPVVRATTDNTGERIPEGKAKSITHLQGEQSSARRRFQKQLF